MVRVKKYILRGLSAELQSGRLWQVLRISLAAKKNGLRLRKRE
jgi:hypothetical protein